MALLRKITRGQELDFVRFPEPGGARAGDRGGTGRVHLPGGGMRRGVLDANLRAHLPRYGRLEAEELRGLGRGFGQGLQLVNILRDLPEDIANGRCYLPMSELREAGLAEAEELRGNCGGRGLYLSGGAERRSHTRRRDAAISRGFDRGGCASRACCHGRWGAHAETDGRGIAA